MATRAGLFRKAVAGISALETFCTVTREECERLGDMSDGFSRRDIEEAVQVALLAPVRKIHDATHYKKVTRPFRPFLAVMFHASLLIAGPGFC